jgi:hypothetical protein
MALGEVSSSFIAGGISLTVSLGTLIGVFQFLAGVALLGILLVTEPVLAGVTLFIAGFFHAPLTVWAQTLRMRIIPEGLRGRTFALLRMLMIGGLPLGGVIGGSLVAASGILPAVVFSALVSGLPGAAGLLVREMRESQRLFASPAD